ncbi:FecR family protein [uncultured Brevundimonas sp.]|uniref:FecR family protein n=1 Tax=uncultured Brevundimonas sp. TaxID=213418 RepID=UPI002618B7FC|nr:FecR domain-containing protein [uncultured Brevundimonas sp.]
MRLTSTPTTEPHESAAEIEASALAWAAKSDRGPLSAEDRIALEAWAATDVRRAGAYARALAANAYLDRASALGSDYRPPRPRLGRREMMAGGGALLAASVVGAVGYGILQRRGRIVTVRGDVRRVSLAEGSAITLNTDTTVRPELGRSERRILLSRGEALFDVAKDPTRPFIVVADGVQVRAVGTSFTVRLRNDGRVDVAVREGVVEVNRGDGPPVRLQAGDRQRVAPDGGVAIERLPLEKIERGMAWREGRLDLTGLTLGEAAQEFGRYTERPIVIDDPLVARMKVAGIYNLSDPAGFARSAALSLGLETTPTPTGVRISRAGTS